MQSITVGKGSASKVMTIQQYINFIIIIINVQFIKIMYTLQCMTVIHVICCHITLQTTYAQVTASDL